MQVRILLPWRNLGCFGFLIKMLYPLRVAGYFDFFLNPYIGMFIRTSKYRIWIRPFSWKMKIECLVEKPESSCLTCRKVVTQPKLHWILHHSSFRKLAAVVTMLMIGALTIGCGNPSSPPQRNPVYVLSFENWKSQDTITANVPITVRVTDSIGVPQSGTSLRFSVDEGTIQQSTTGSDGRAYTTWVLPSSLGKYTLSVEILSSRITDSITVLPGQPASFTLDTTSIRIVVSARFPVSRRITNIQDRLGNLVTAPITVSGGGWNTAGDTIWSDNRIHSPITIRVGNNLQPSAVSPFAVIDQGLGSATYEDLRNTSSKVGNLRYSCLDIPATDSAGNSITADIYYSGVVDSLFYRGEPPVDSARYSRDSLSGQYYTDSVYGSRVVIYVTRTDSIVEPNKSRVVTHLGIMLLYDQAGDTAWVGGQSSALSGYAVRSDSGYVGGNACVVTKPSATRFEPLFLQFEK